MVFYEDVFSVCMVVLKFIERSGMRYIWNVMVFMECDGMILRVMVYDIDSRVMVYGIWYYDIESDGIWYIG